MTRRDDWKTQIVLENSPMKLLSTILVLFLLAGMVWAAERPNIVVVLCDDLGYGDVACYGHTIIQTPNLDRLAAEGIRFTDFYSTAPVCSASRAGLLTGRTPSRIGVFDWIPSGHVMHLKESETTIATVLKNAGYDTAYCGKWHCNGKFNSPEQPQPNDHGFDHWFATQNNAAPSHENPVNFVRNGTAVGRIEGYSCQLVVEEAMNWLDKRPDPTRPFFLMVGFHEPHEPVSSPPELVAQYKAKGAVKPGEAEYYANVGNMDAALGRLITHLKEHQLWNNTLTVFTSDNGPETLNRYRGAERSHGSPGDLRGMKLWIYEGGYRVAGIAAWPQNIQPGQVSRTPVGAIDFFPTFCNIAQAELPKDRVLDGTNLVPFLSGGELSRHQPLFWYYINALGEPRVAIRDGDWKLIASLEGNPRPQGQGGAMSSEWFATVKTAQLGRFELYNLNADKNEKDDLATQEPERVAKMKQILEKIFREVQSDAPVWK
jgi:arylsulfatase A